MLLANRVKSSILVGLRIRLSLSYLVFHNFKAVSNPTAPELYSLLLGSRGKKKIHAELPQYGRGVRGLCIIDEALYRQTKLNTETLAALPRRRRRRVVVGGWVSAGEGERERGETCNSFNLVIVFAQC